MSDEATKTTLNSKQLSKLAGGKDGMASKRDSTTRSRSSKNFMEYFEEHTIETVDEMTNKLIPVYKKALSKLQ